MGNPRNWNWATGRRSVGAKTGVETLALQRWDGGDTDDERKGSKQCPDARETGGEADPHTHTHSISLTSKLPKSERDSV